MTFFCINLIKFMFIFKMMDTEIPCSRELESSGDKTVSRCKTVFLCWLIGLGMDHLILRLWSVDNGDLKIFQTLESTVGSGPLKNLLERVRSILKTLGR